MNQSWRYRRFVRSFLLGTIVVTSVDLASSKANPKVRKPKILVHGHRGARARRPENTIPAFQYAIKLGVDVLELDMAVTKDDALVISHDPILRPPVCTGPVGNAAIHSLTLEQVRKWDCGGTKNPKFPDQEPVKATPMPTLDEVFQLANEGSFDFNIETKSFVDKPEYTPTPEKFVRLVLDKISQYRLQKRVILQSFDFRTLKAMKQIAPEIRRSALVEKDGRSFVTIAGEAEADIVSPKLDLVTADKVKAAHEAHIVVIPWTADTEADWQRMVDANVDGIITDDPGALIAYLKERGLR